MKYVDKKLLLLPFLLSACCYDGTVILRSVYFSNYYSLKSFLNSNYNVSHSIKPFNYTFLLNTENFIEGTRTFELKGSDKCKKNHKCNCDNERDHYIYMFEPFGIVEHCILTFNNSNNEPIEYYLKYYINDSIIPTDFRKIECNDSKTNIPPMIPEIFNFLPDGEMEPLSYIFLADNIQLFYILVINVIGSNSEYYDENIYQDNMNSIKVLLNNLSNSIDTGEFI